MLGFTRVPKSACENELDVQNCASPGRVYDDHVDEIDHVRNHKTKKQSRQNGQIKQAANHKTTKMTKSKMKICVKEPRKQSFNCEIRYFDIYVESE